MMTDRARCQTGGVRVLAISHQADAGPGVFAEAARERGEGLDEWLLPEGGAAPSDPASYDAVMVFGGSMHADQEPEHPWIAGEKALLRELLDAGVPLLGVCLGSQLVAEAAGAPVEPASRPEIGWLEVELTPEGVYISCWPHSRRAALHGVPMAQLPVTAAPGGGLSRAARWRCRPTAPASARGASSSMRRSPSATRSAGPLATTKIPRRSRSVSTRTS